jgi:hypothetical protein
LDGTDFLLKLAIGLQSRTWRLTVINGEFGSQEIRPVQNFPINSTKEERGGAKTRKPKG